MRDRLISVRDNVPLLLRDWHDFNADMYLVLDLAYRRFEASMRFVQGDRQGAMNRAAMTALKLMVVYERGVVYPWTST